MYFSLAVIGQPSNSSSRVYWGVNFAFSGALGFSNEILGADEGTRPGGGWMYCLCC
jgi:hypothetical protein